MVSKYELFNIQFLKTPTVENNNADDDPLFVYMVYNDNDGLLCVHNLSGTTLNGDFTLDESANFTNYNTFAPQDVNLSDETLNITIDGYSSKIVAYVNTSSEQDVQARGRFHTFVTTHKNIRSVVERYAHY